MGSDGIEVAEGLDDKFVQEGEARDGDGVIPLSLDEIKACNIGEMSKDKFKSRQLQRSLARGSQEHIDLIFEKAEPFFSELVKDQHGNYLLQKILEVVSTEQFDKVFDALKGDLIALAKDGHGTRGVQKIVEQAIARDRTDLLMQALPAEQAEELARNITGFHVIVKLLDALPADKSATLLDRLCGDPQKVLALGKDQWGCCVLKKCVDRSEGAMKEKVIDSIAANAYDLVQDPFGNYVVQHLIINRPLGQNNPNVGRIIDNLKGHVLELSLQKFSSNVLEKCLGNSIDKDRNKIINEILNPPNGQKPSEAVRSLLFHQFGNYVFQQALEVSKDPQFALLIEHSKAHIQALYIEHTKQHPQGGKVAPGEHSGTSGGSLPAEHTQRLAVKLVKKYPSFMEGMDMGHMMGMEMDTSWMFPAYDGMGYGMDPYAMNTMMGMDPYAMGNFGMEAMMMWPQQQAYFPVPAAAKGGARGGGNRGGKEGRRGKGKGKGGGGGATAAPGDGADMRVGRIVGFWPNYEITYDDVPAPGGTKRGTRGPGDKGKRKEKAAGE